jgi:hypothetical protein
MIVIHNVKPVQVMLIIVTYVPETEFLLMNVLVQYII